MIIDTHAHLFWESFQEDYDAVIQRAVDAGVTELINVGVDLSTSEKALRLTAFARGILAEQRRSLTFYSSIGIHPHEAINYAENQGQILADVKKLADIYQSNPAKIVGVGECGLDYFFENNPGWAPSALSTQQIKESQKQLLKTQVNLAKNLDLPLIIHCREAWEDIFDYVKDHYGVFHCYTADAIIAKKILATNFYVSFAAIITYPKNDYLREVAKMLPLDRIIVETDSPFLPPQGKRGQRNEPANIAETIQTIADVRGITKEELEQAVYKNTKKIFKLA